MSLPDNTVQVMAVALPGVCINCHQPEAEHLDGQCLFSPTQYRAMTLHELITYAYGGLDEKQKQEVTLQVLRNAEEGPR